MENELLELIEEIKQKNILVVVEGTKDQKSLARLGLTRVLTLSKPLYAVVEEIAAHEREVVLLVDLDSEGKKLYHKLAIDLQRYGIVIHDELREKLFLTPIRHIEGLATYIANLKLRSQNL